MADLLREGFIYNGSLRGKDRDQDIHERMAERQRNKTG